MISARAAWLVLGLLGVALLVPFESPVTLTAGVLLLVCFVATGVALIASPEFVEGDGDDGET